MTTLNTLFTVKNASLPAMALTLFMSASSHAHANHPNLVLTQPDVASMKQGIKHESLFRDEFLHTQQLLDEQMRQPMDVPVPKDGGGGVTHERHKKNYQLMNQAGVMYQLTNDVKYANYVRDMLLKYADLYPKIGLHPQRKKNSQNPGKLFWQILNEAVWLVHTIQAYDAVMPAISKADRATIEQGIIRPVAQFLSVESPTTFNKVHNHGTWATAAVGMTGYVLGDQELVEQALYGIDKSGTGGFLKQLDVLFSPQGYYTEGPYYQRYALLPFITFAKAIENNEPQRKIFEYRDGVILKAITSTIELSYNGLFFGINDAIKSKGIDTNELVQGVTIAYGLTQDPQLLDIAQRQNQILLTGDGLKVANALDNQQQQAYQFSSIAFGDGSSGKEGALVVMRQGEELDQAVVFKATAQGLGHGHFDKLNWIFYDHGQEVVSDYGAARFLNIEAKFGGRYLPENNSYAKQTVAHNTVVVDETSHFNGVTKRANQSAPTLNYFVNDEQVKLANASIDDAYPNVTLERTMALIKLDEQSPSIVVDVFDVSATEKHQYDLPLQYTGHFIESNFVFKNNSQKREALGNKAGYQHLWLTAQATPKQPLAQVTWLNENGRFYTQSSVLTDDTQMLFTQTGANDPNFNLRNNNAVIQRVSDVKSHQFVNVIEPHGDYNPSKEYTLQATSRVKNVTAKRINDIQVVDITFVDGKKVLFAVNQGEQAVAAHSFSYNNKQYQFNGRYLLVTQ